MIKRKKFLQQAAMGLAGTVGLPLLGKASALHAYQNNKTGSLKIGVAGFTFARFDVAQSASMIKRLDIKYLSIKDFHLPINSDADKIKSVLGAFADAGCKVYAVGVIYMKTEADVDAAFDYAKRVGVDMIVGVPTYELLDYTEQKVKSSGIRIAIHNHGPEDKLYPAPQNVYDHIKNRDARMGLCLDIGHAVRAGANLVQSVKEYKSRLFDMHIKDVTGAYKDAKAIEIGRGVIDFPALVKTLKSIQYNGVCSIEFEKDMTDPLPGIAESIGYFRGIMASV
ncbi:sugar phosphate isomerase/epimerase [Ilyomonas limi]|uniref:Sugar phosphate isomerase/epimerase n=1 Tax=Ilyomonas limi TaxID=2575867 RepID=A0A4U3L9D0_9BACT|nr:sugar phosphate isomerase/epimerase [Ilyomonas limi]TKK71898.1 sugar phosphate isomerase/epimerase [Ilyomonas limi]